MCCLAPSLLLVIPDHWCLAAAGVTGVTAWGTKLVGVFYLVWGLLGHRLCHCKGRKRRRGSQYCRCLSREQGCQVHRLCHCKQEGVESWAPPQLEGQSWQAPLPLLSSSPWLQVPLWLWGQCGASPEAAQLSGIAGSATVAGGLGLQALPPLFYGPTSSVWSSSPTFRYMMCRIFSWPGVLGTGTLVELWMFYWL